MPAQENRLRYGIVENTMEWIARICLVLFFVAVLVEWKIKPDSTDVVLARPIMFIGIVAIGAKDVMRQVHQAGRVTIISVLCMIGWCVAAYWMLFGSLAWD